MNVPQPTADDWHLRNKMDGKLNEQDIFLMATYRNNLIGRNNDMQKTSDIIDLQSAERRIEANIQVQEQFFCMLVNILAATLTYWAVWVSDTGSALDCHGWDVMEWCQYLTEKLILSKDNSEGNYTRQQNARGIVQVMQQSLGNMIRELGNRAPARLYNLYSIDEWIDELSKMANELQDRYKDLSSTRQAIGNLGWMSVMGGVWVPEDHRIWIYRYWDEILKNPIPNRPDYPYYKPRKSTT